MGIASYSLLTPNIGTGSHARRKTIINGQIRNGLFEGITANIDTAGGSLIEDISVKVATVLEDTLSSVQADFQVAYGSASIEELRAVQAAKELDEAWTWWQLKVEEIRGVVEGGVAASVE